jgi:hypothetical protein
MSVALNLKKRATQRCQLTSLNPATVRLVEWGFLRYFMYFQLTTHAVQKQTYSSNWATLRAVSSL